MRGMLRRALLNFFKASLGYKFYNVSGIVLLFYLRIISDRGCEKRILYGKKTVFQSEMQAISDGLNLSTLAIDRDYLRLIVHHFFDVKNKFHLPSENALTPKCGSMKEFEDYCSAYFWPALKRLRVKTWVSCNFYYYYEKPFQLQCEAQGIESVLLMKECYKSPAMHLAWSRYFAGYVSEGIPAVRIAVGNKRTKTVISDLGLFPSEAITVVGSPRLEALAKKVESLRDPNDACSSPFVVFFESGIKAGLPKFGATTEVYEVLDDLNITPSAYDDIVNVWKEIQKKILSDSVVFAMENPHVAVVYKQKTGAAPPEIPDIAKDLKNWRTTVGGTNEDLVRTATFCVGFNTSAILEAVFSGVPVLSPSVSELTDYCVDPFIMDYGRSIEFYKEVSELKFYLESGSRQFGLDEVHNLLAAASDDGAVSARVSWSGIRNLFG